MKAIDFATHLARAILTTKLSLHESATLIAIAAGLELANDIARQLDQPRTGIHNSIHSLTKRNLIRPATWLDDGTPVYRLTPAGRELIINHFLVSIPKH